MSLDRPQAISGLLAAIDTYLTKHPFAGLADVRAGIARARTLKACHLKPPPPVVGCLADAVSAIPGEDALKSAIAAAAPFLSWVSYDVYPREEIGDRFPDAHAFASLIGEGAPYPMDDFDLGLFLIAPRVSYRDHSHAAPELYAPLTGPHRWRFGVDQPWRTLQAHEPVWNEPWQVHATITGDTPFLSIFCWTRDVNRAAKVVFASDWDVIEAGL